MNLRELGSYKLHALSKIRKSKDIQELLLGNDFDEDLVDDLLDNHVYSFLYVPETQLETKTYICCDVDVPSTSGLEIKNMRLIIWCFCHKDIMKYSKDGYIGTRTDICADMIDKVINSSRDFGIGRIELKSANILKPLADYYGREIIYECSDFNIAKKL